MEHLSDTAEIKTTASNSESYSDLQLLDLLKSNDSKNYAFNLLIRKYQRPIYTLIRRLVTDHEDANDLIQDTFIKVWKNIASFKGEAALYTWIYRIATNEAISFLRKKKLRSFIRLTGTVKKALSSNKTSISTPAEEIEERLQKAIALLPVKQRVVFNLRYYDEMPYEKMSEALHTSEGALKASFHHAVRKIEEYITSGVL